MSSGTSGRRSWSRCARAAERQALKKPGRSGRFPREADAKWPDAAKKLHADWWQARIARQKEIDASIAAKAEFEYLYDKPYEDKKKVRVAGPFTVESLSPHRVLGVDENDELIDPRRREGPKPIYGEEADFRR
jgi:adenine-specific DNA-methyltransferase